MKRNSRIKKNLTTRRPLQRPQKTRRWHIGMAPFLVAMVVLLAILIIVIVKNSDMKKSDEVVPDTFAPISSYTTTIKVKSRPSTIYFNDDPLARFILVALIIVIIMVNLQTFLIFEHGLKWSKPETFHFGYFHDPSVNTNPKDYILGLLVDLIFLFLVFYYFISELVLFYTEEERELVIQDSNGNIIEKVEISPRKIKVPFSTQFSFFMLCCTLPATIIYFMTYRIMFRRRLERIENDYLRNETALDYYLDPTVEFEDFEKMVPLYVHNQRLKLDELDKNGVFGKSTVAFYKQKMQDREKKFKEMFADNNLTWTDPPVDNN